MFKIKSNIDRFLFIYFAQKFFKNFSAISKKNQRKFEKKREKTIELNLNSSIDELV